VTDRLCRFGGADLVDAPGDTPIPKDYRWSDVAFRPASGSAHAGGVDTVLDPAVIGHELRRQRGL
jgi:hypothetical protein